MGVILCLTTAVGGAGQKIHFNRDIRPILADHCFQCHGPDEAKRKAGLRLDTEDGAKADLGGYAAIVPGDLDNSLLILRIHHEDAEEIMPPPATKKPLTDREKHLLRSWIGQGAPWEKHWAFVAPEKAPLPRVAQPDWCRNEIDYFVLDRLADEGLAPSPEAHRATLLRRLSLDLTGLPPTPEEVDAFIDDPSPNAYDALATRLLLSPRYGEHMAWQWLEAARYADTDGYQNDGPRSMWPWRGWVIDAYNRHLPFDRFTIEQLAGDLLPNASLDQIVATGFNRNHRYNSESGLVLEEFLLENAVDRVDTTSTVWLGLTMGCARCHDHKYDPISQREYYQLIAYFNNVPESGRAIKYGNSEPWVKAPTPEQRRRLAELDREVKRAKSALSQAEAEIAEVQAAREGDLSAPQPIVAHGLTKHYKDPIDADGVKGATLDEVPGLIGNGRFSIAFRMTPHTTSGGAVLSNETKDTTRKGILIEMHHGRLRCYLISRWIAGVTGVETHHPMAMGKAVHITLTNDGTQRAQGLRVYVDGLPVETRTLHNTYSNKASDHHGGPMRVGASAHRSPWKGRVEDLRFYGKRTLSPVEAALLAEPMSIPEIAALPTGTRTRGQRDVLRHYFLEHGAPETLSRLATRLRSAEASRQAYHDALPTSMVMREMSEPRETHVRLRGVYHQPGQVVSRRTPEVFPPMAPGLPSDRLGFASWLVSGHHPLTARVAVNRHWQLLFGRGLVKTAEDFGVQGSMPSHPELLDWLAVDFVESGWDVGRLVHKITSSATYRQTSRLTPQLLEVDPTNVLLARAPRRRLPGNVLRDQALFVSGLLVERRGGASVKPYQPAGLWREASNFTYEVGQGSDLYRRSLYTYWKRTLAPPSMAILDAADREWCSVNPKETNTPLQALTLLNETAFFEAARKLGERMLATGDSLDEQIAFAFRTVTSRSPSQRENAVLRRAFLSYENEFAANPEAARRSLRVGQSGMDASLGDHPALAAAAALANVLLNLEEVTTRE